MQRCLLSLCMLLLSAPLFSSTAHAREWLAPDFFVDTVVPGQGLAWMVSKRPTDCRANISRVMCVGFSAVDEDFRATPDMSRGCDSDDAKYVAFFEAVYDRLPSAMQKMFCSVRVLRVEPNLESIAYAGMGFNGAEVGFRKSVIDDELDLSTLMSWKEQLPYGGERDVYAPVSTLPRIAVASDQPPVQDLAFYVLTHEFGHLFDFANDINNGPSGPRDWTALSWRNESRVLPEQDFPGRAQVCYYNCGDRIIPRSKIPALYAGLDASNFVTMYAATNIYDDFAESVAMTLMADDPSSSYVLTDGQGASYDAHVKLKSPQFARKAAYVADFLQRKDLDYP